MNLNEAKQILNENGFILEGAGAEGFANFHKLQLEKQAMKKLITALDKQGIEYKTLSDSAFKVETDEGSIILSCYITKRTISQVERAVYTVRGKYIRSMEFNTADEVVDFVLNTNQTEKLEELKEIAKEKIQKFWSWWKEVKNLPPNERKFNDTFTKQDRKDIYTFINASDHDWEAIVPAKYVEFINNKLYYLK